MKVAIFLADGFEEIEAISVLDVLRRGEFTVDSISISENLEVKGAHGISIITDKVFSKVKFDNYDILVLPGGMPGTTNLLKHKGLCNLLKEFNLEGKTIGAICAAPIVLGHLEILKDKEGTCYPGFEEQLIDCNIINENVVVSDNIITAKGAGVALNFALKILSTKRDDAYIERLMKTMIILS